MSMNIQQAKEFIRDTVKLYLKKDEYGEYRIPVVRQRPVFLLGAPGVGKTAIMEQIAQELNVAIVSYSMTHHTRQSALGLPFISHKTYDGQSFDISEYTMSEIIASVYEVMEKSGVKEGILFLDEINCVSETLAPAMLQFLQYKTFGRHSDSIQTVIADFSEILFKKTIVACFIKSVLVLFSIYFQIIFSLVTSYIQIIQIFLTYINCL